MVRAQADRGCGTQATQSTLIEDQGGVATSAVAQKAAQSIGRGEVEPVTSHEIMNLLVSLFAGLKKCEVLLFEILQGVEVFARGSCAGA